MLEFLKTKNEYSISALKTIANSMASLDTVTLNQVVEELVDFGALKYLFPIILRQGLKGKDIDEQMTID